VRLIMRQSLNPAIATALVVMAMLVGACSGPGSSNPSGGSASGDPSPAPDALKVVATTTVFADIVQNAGGTRVAASSIIPPGVGPED